MCTTLKAIHTLKVSRPDFIRNQALQQRHLHQSRAGNAQMRTGRPKKRKGSLLADRRSFKKIGKETLKQEA